MFVSEPKRRPDTGFRAGRRGDSCVNGRPLETVVTPPLVVRCRPRTCRDECDLHRLTRGPQRPVVADQLTILRPFRPRHRTVPTLTADLEQADDAVDAIPLTDHVPVPGLDLDGGEYRGLLGSHALLPDGAAGPARATLARTPDGFSWGVGATQGLRVTRVWMFRTVRTRDLIGGLNIARWR